MPKVTTIEVTKSIEILVMRMIYPFAILGLLLSAVLCGVFAFTGIKILWAGLLLWLGFTVAAMVLYVLVLGIVGLCVDTKGEVTKNHRGFRRVIVFCMGLLLKLSRVRVRVVGEEQLPRQERFLLVCNHCSNYDPLVAVWGLRKWEMAFVMKPEILKIPIAGPIAHMSGYMALDRDDNRAALKTILHAADLLKQGEISVGIFPEGTRNRGQGLLPFRNGAFKIAQRAKAPIAVVRLENTAQAAKNLPWKSTHVTVRVCGMLTADDIAGCNTTQIGDQVLQLMTHTQ